MADKPQGSRARCQKCQDVAIYIELLHRFAGIMMISWRSESMTFFADSGLVEGPGAGCRWADWMRLNR